MVDIYVVKIDYDFNELQYNRLITKVGTEKRAAIMRFLRREDGLRALFAEILIRYIVCHKLHIGNSEIIFDKNEYGKPFIKHFPALHHNISHSGHWVVCAVDNETVGIDVEIIKPIDMNIADRFFSQKECMALFSKDESEKLSYFFDLWTLKESYIKAWGKGLSIPLDSFSMVEIAEKDFVVETINEFKACYFKQYKIDPQYKLSVCSLRNTFPESIIFIQPETLYHFFVD